jgi:hypothetical protein
VGEELKMFLCRFRSGSHTTAVECLAPSAEDAAYVVGTEALKEDSAPWIQVVASQWVTTLSQYIDPVNAMMVTREDEPTPGADRVILQRRVPYQPRAQPD